MRDSQQAYTLFEAMLALAIIAILSAISIPSLRNLIDSSNDRILQSQLLRTIQFMRQEAHVRGVPVSVCKSKTHVTCGGEWSDGLLVFIDERGDGIVQDEQQILSVIQMKTHHGKLYWRAYPYYRDYLRCVPAKWPSADNGMFWYCRPKNELPVFAITVNKLGGGRVVYPDENGQIKDSRGRVIRC